ncbi:MAG: hypothetical protein IJD18_01825 [Clostridia bacterium]|nr:hypothetical protein [Clostridia bacterium]
MKIIRPKGVLVCVGLPLLMVFFTGLLAVSIYCTSKGLYSTGITGIVISVFAILLLVAEVISHKIVLQEKQLYIFSRKYFFWFTKQEKILKFENLQSLQVVVTITGSNTLAKLLCFSYKDEKQNYRLDIARFSHQQISQLLQSIQSNAKEFCNQEVEVLEESNITESHK